MTITASQILEFDELQERLVDVALREADPASWVRDTDEKTTAMRLKQKQSAAATLTLVTKIASVLNYMRDQGGPPPEGDDVPDPTAPTRTEIEKAAKEAKRILEGASGKT